MASACCINYLQSGIYYQGPVSARYDISLRGVRIHNCSALWHTCCHGTFDAIAISDVSTLSRLTTLSIPFGQRLSGWVGVNRQTVVNSRATLDFGASHALMELESAVCTPVLLGVAPFGVVSVYRSVDRDFNTHDKILAEHGARTLARHLDYLRCNQPTPWKQASS
jgi:hypothetical protein